MPCILLVVMLAFPRVAIALLYLLTNFFERAHLGILMVLLGFLFLPLTTIVYAWMVNSGYPIDGIYLIGLIVTVLIDLGAIGGGGYSRRRG